MEGAERDDNDARGGDAVDGSQMGVGSHDGAFPCGSGRYMSSLSRCRVIGLG